eukprot:s480_g6.t1
MRDACGIPNRTWLWHPAEISRFFRSPDFGAILRGSVPILCVRPLLRSRTLIARLWEDSYEDADADDDGDDDDDNGDGDGDRDDEHDDDGDEDEDHDDDEGEEEDDDEHEYY